MCTYTYEMRSKTSLLRIVTWIALAFHLRIERNAVSCFNSFRVNSDYNTIQHSNEACRSIYKKGKLLNFIKISVTRTNFFELQQSSSIDPSIQVSQETLNIGAEEENEEDKKKNNKLLKLIQNITTAQIRGIKWFTKLSSKAKALLSIQLLILGFIFSNIIQKHTNIRIFPNSISAKQRMIPSRKLKPMEVPYSTFLDLAEEKFHDAAPRVSNVIVSKDRISFWYQKEGKQDPPRPFYTIQTSGASPELIQLMRNNKLSFRSASTAVNRGLARTVQSLIICFYFIFLLRMYQTMAGGGAGAGGGITGKLFKRKKNTANNKVDVVSFDDIEGCDKAKFEVMELVDTLKNPGKYAILGARAPTGLLLYGPPGTGKTMLAKATAASAGVPLIYCSGSDFIEMFVGRGAARVRKTFEKASKLSPCIVFIDELDTLGKSRDRGAMRLQSNDEADQTLNQLLACMDGLDSKKGVCVLAATNRKDVLDPALIRPGRFDRIIQLELPDAAGREKILRVHANKLPGFNEGSGIDDRIGSLGKGTAVDLSAIAAATPGLSGAELEFIVNEAAIRAVRRVSAKLREGVDPSTITPMVSPQDFEASLMDFYETRKSSKGNVVGGLLDNVFRN